MQQSSATHSLRLSFWGLRKIVLCSHSSSQCLLVSTFFGTVSSLHPTSFLMIFMLVIILSTGPCHFSPDPHHLELKRAHKTAVKEEKREKRKTKVPKHIKKRKEKLWKQRHGK